MALFEQLRSPLLRYVAMLGLPPQDAEEVAQETFLALIEHLNRDKPRDNLRGWVFRVGHNLALKLLERRRRRGDDIVPGGEIAGAQLNPEQMAAANQRQRRLHAVVSALGERDRACLALRAEGLRYRDIAAVLGISVGSVASSLARSLNRLLRAGVR